MPGRMPHGAQQRAQKALHDAALARAAQQKHLSDQLAHPPVSPARRAGRRRTSQVLGVVAAILLVSLIGLAIWLLIDRGIINLNESGVRGTSTVILRVREAPTASSQILGRLSPGQEVELDCQTAGGWDRLVNPFEGAYVFDDYIRRSQHLERC
ncbi:MAG TPA: SH3 domain-containing protein [Actinomycetota bacterium]|nr:SH3 domain-containing protein [Actinomycetota bacterium]